MNSKTCHTTHNTSCHSYTKSRNEETVGQKLSTPTFVAANGSYCI